MKSNARMYDAFVKIKSVTESCKTLDQTFMAERMRVQFCRVFQVSNKRSYLARELARQLGNVLDTAQRAAFKTTDEFEEWADMNPRWIAKRRRSSGLNVEIRGRIPGAQS